MSPSSSGRHSQICVGLPSVPLLMSIPRVWSHRHTNGELTNRPRDRPWFGHQRRKDAGALSGIDITPSATTQSLNGTENS